MLRSAAGPVFQAFLAPSYTSSLLAQSTVPGDYIDLLQLVRNINFVTPILLDCFQETKVRYIPNPAPQMSSPSSEAGTAIEHGHERNGKYGDDHPGKIYEKEKVTFRVIMLCILASMGGFIFGYDTGEISGLVAMPDFIDRFGSNGSFSNVREGLIVSLLSVGSLVGCVSAGPLADLPRLGRKGLIMTACVIFIVGTIIQISSVTSWVQLMVGRFIAGIGKLFPDLQVPPDRG